MYTLDAIETEDWFITNGVNGIIPDHFPPPGYIQDGPIDQLLDVMSQHPEVHLATRNDNPFQPANQAYGIQVYTSNVTDAGTDAALTFTLNGCKGSASVTTLTGLIAFNPFPYQSGRMEKDQFDYVTLPSLDLGRLSSLTIENGGGPGSGWHLGDVHVRSARWIKSGYDNLREYSGAWDDWVEHGQPPVSVPLAANFQEELPTIQCPAPVTVASAPDHCSAIVSFSATASDVCPGVIAVSDPPSGDTFPVGTTVVSSHAENPPAPDSPACTFTVTVQDKQNPAITCPAPLVVNATGPQGAAVSFTSPTASDNCAVASVLCAPSSGSVFPVGTDFVTCTAKDPAANQSSCAFTIHVKGALEQTADLITAVKNLATKASIKKALLDILSAALAALQKQDPANACGALQAFIQAVSAQRGKFISPGDADALVAAAAQIRAVIGCK